MIRSVALLLCLAAPLAAQAWTPGSRVHANAAVCARADTASTTCGTLRALGDKGTVVRGPAGSTTRYGTSWFIHYDVAPDGWSTAQYLTLDTLFVPPVSTSDTARAWTLASRVHATDSVCAHATVTYAGACGTQVGKGTKGSITGGPGTDAGWTFWLVRFDNAVTGWARQALLALDTLGVPPPVAAHVQVRPVAVTLTVGASLLAVATVTDATGHVLAQPVTWTSATGATTVDTAGTITARTVGVDTVRASVGAIVGFTVVTVVPPPPPPPVVWSIRQGWFASLLLARPACAVPVSPGTVTCGPYAVANDSTGLVTSHVTITFTVSP